MRRGGENLGNVDNSKKIQQFSELMTLEARRDFLLQHLEKLSPNNTPTPLPSAASSTDRTAQSR